MIDSILFLRPWWIFHYRLIDLEREEPGVYELADLRKEVLYIGRAENIRERLLQHVADMSKNPCLSHAAFFRAEYVRDSAGALEAVLSGYASTHEGKLPPCNRERT